MGSGEGRRKVERERRKEGEKTARREEGEIDREGNRRVGTR
jgi:hypothetical protein